MPQALALACCALAGALFLAAPDWGPSWWIGQSSLLTGLILVVIGLTRPGLASSSHLDPLATFRQGGESALAAANEANAALADRLLAAERAKLQSDSLFTLAPDAMLVVDANGEILRANDSARSLFGYPEAQWTGRRLADLAVGKPEIVDCAALLASPRRSHSFTALRHDGGSFPAELSSNPLQFDGRTVLLLTVRDMSPASAGPAAARPGEQRFRDIFDQAPIGMALIALDGRLVEVNEALCNLLGFERSALLQRRESDITHADDLSSCLQSFRQLVAGETDSLQLEKRYLHHDGTVIWTLVSASLQRDPGGAPQLVTSQIVDIGGIKAARDALAESEKRLQRVLEGSNDGFWDRHIPSGVTTYSARWAAMLGYGNEEIRPDVASWENLVHPEDLEMCRRLLEQHLSGRRDRYEAVYRMRHRSGHWVWILARGKAYEWDAEGRPLRVAGTHTDVTVRQFTMEALRMREQTLKAVLEALPIGIWIANADGRITSANAAALALGPCVRYRCLTQDRQQQDVWEESGRSVAPHDRALSQAIERREKVGEQLVEIEFADGTRKTVLNSGLPVLDESGMPLGAIAVNQDMTRWLKLEQDLLRRSQQLEESNRELEQFAYVASHDLQEPLRKVSSFAQLFAKKYSDRLDQSGQTYIDFMVDGANRMQTLVDDLLHYSRLTRGDRSHYEVDMSRVMQGVLSDLQMTINDAGAEVRTEPLPVVVGDAGQLRALLQNLISNAVKYRAPERRPAVEIGASVHGGEATFWVRDNGIGIDPRYFERIFVIFQRLHTRAEYPGTGIGLAICKKIVDNHGGRIWLESAPDQGATFFFTLPAGEARS